MTADDWTGLVEHALWPVVVLVSVLVLRRQIGDFLSAWGGRITRVSVMSVTVELAVATEAAPPWQGREGDDVRGLVPAPMVNDSYFDTLRQSLDVPGSADYFVVDLKSDGQEWLTTRLYLFSWLLSRLKGIRAVVFVGTRADVARSYLAVAPTHEIMRALGAAQPWLRIARLQVEAGQVGRLPDLPGPLPPPAPGPGPATPVVPADVDDWWGRLRAKSVFVDPLYLAQQFLQWVQWEQPPGMPDPGDAWLRLPEAAGRPTTWEHASWLRSSDLTDGPLRDIVCPDCAVVDDPSWSAEERVRAVVRAPGELVALLTSTRRFERLVDRRALLEALSTTL